MNNSEKLENKNERKIADFEDLRGLDLSGIDMHSSFAENLVTVDFDTETKWPGVEKLPADFDPEKLLRESKNPGLGLRKLHSQGINGEGVLVAIIDQKLLTEHEECVGKIESYTQYVKTEKEEPGMHGVAVASLLVGGNCGVAPGAKLVYMATPSGREFVHKAKALNDIAERNKKLEPNRKIRVVSCSVGFMEQNPEQGLDRWIDAIKRATDEGIIVVDVSDRLGIKFLGGGTYLDKENPDDYYLWLNFKNSDDIKNPKIDPQGATELPIIVPSDYRTMASWKGNDEYVYNGKGGMSWSVPYLAGLFALALQVNPNLKQREIVEMINESATINKSGLKVINPEGIIELVKKRIKS